MVKSKLCGHFSFRLFSKAKTSQTGYIQQFHESWLPWNNFLDIPSQSGEIKKKKRFHMKNGHGKQSILFLSEKNSLPSDTNLGTLAKMHGYACQDLGKILPRSYQGYHDHARSWQGWPCVLPSVPRFSMYLTKLFHVSCQAYQDFSDHFEFLLHSRTSVIRTRYLNRSGNSMICIIVGKS